MYSVLYCYGGNYALHHFGERAEAQEYVMNASAGVRSACEAARNAAPDDQKVRFETIVRQDAVMVVNPAADPCCEMWVIAPVVLEGKGADTPVSVKAFTKQFVEAMGGNPTDEQLKDVIATMQELVLTGLLTPYERRFTATLKLPASRLAFLDKFLTGEVIQGEGCVEAHSVRFPDGMVMDLKVCGCSEDPSWAESVLFAPSSEPIPACPALPTLDEVACSGVEDDFIGPSELEYNGTNYVVDVVDGGDIDAPILLIMENPLKENLCDWAVDGKPVIPGQPAWVAVACSDAVRDVQVCSSKECDLQDDDSWEDWGQAEVYLGVFRGTKAEAMKAAQESAGIDQDNIRLYQI